MSTRSVPSIPQQYVPLAASAAIILIAVVVIGVSQLAGRPRALQITPIPPSTVSTPVRLSAPLSAPTGTPVIAPARLIDAYAAPDGVVLGPIEDTRPMAVVAHYGGDWLQADVEGSGRVWLRAADVPGVALAGPDLTPPTPAPRADFAPAQNWQPPAVQQPEPPAEPTVQAQPEPTVMWIPTATPAGWNGGGGSGW
jgi:hypothetical protein